MDDYSHLFTVIYINSWRVRNRTPFSISLNLYLYVDGIYYITLVGPGPGNPQLKGCFDMCLNMKFEGVIKNVTIDTVPKKPHRLG